MLRRFLAFLLIVGLAVPAIAVPAAAPPMREHLLTVMAGHDNHHAADKQQGSCGHGERHDCIGCAPGVTCSAAPPEVIPLPALAPMARTLAALHGLIGAPQTPPPQLLA